MTFMLAELVDGHDVRMLQLSRGFRFNSKPFQLDFAG